MRKIALAVGVALGVAVAVLASCHSAKAEGGGSPAPAACHTPAMVLDRLAEKNPGIEVMSDMTGDKGATWLQALNELPPPTGIVGDEVVVYTKPGAPNYAVVVFDKGCSVGWTLLDLDGIKAVTQRAIELDTTQPGI